MGWVSRNDWERYPKGRAIPGEILVEVKGLAEKVALVPDDFPQEVLVTGTLYKMLINEIKANRYYVLVYLLSRFGKHFRDRLKTNTLISYVNKEQLYNIPIPLLPDTVQAEISNLYQNAYSLFVRSKRLYGEAEQMLLDVLGLHDLDLSNELYSVGLLTQAVTSQRLDTDYFQDKYSRAFQAIKKTQPQDLVPLSALINVVTNGHTPLRHDLSLGEVPFLTAEHIFDFRVNFESEKRILYEHHANLLQRTQLKNKDIVVTIKGRVGNVAVIENVPGHVNINQDVALLRLKAGYHPYYIAGFLNSLVGKALVEQMSTGQINPFLGLGKLQQILIPIFDKQQMDGIGNAIEEKISMAYAGRESANFLLEKAKNMIEDLIIGESTNG